MIFIILFLHQINRINQVSLKPKKPIQILRKKWLTNPETQENKILQSHLLSPGFPGFFIISQFDFYI
jgi:hypothetical protein